MFELNLLFFLLLFSLSATNTSSLSTNTPYGIFNLALLLIDHHLQNLFHLLPYQISIHDSNHLSNSIICICNVQSISVTYYNSSWFIQRCINLTIDLYNILQLLYLLLFELYYFHLVSYNVIS